MNKPPSWSSHEEALLLLNAYLDDELDAASALDIERRLASDPALRAEHERLFKLREVLRSHVTAEQGSEDFRARIAAIGEARPANTEVALRSLEPGPARRMVEWRMIAVAAMLAAFVTAGGMYVLLRPNPEAAEIASIVADHQRALLAAAPYDVASSDRHTVKPWFDSKLALSPQVVDLASEGFPLAGGRVEIVDGKPVPVLVYHRRAHVISVAALPRSGQAATTSPALVASQDGYAVIRWRGRDFDYVVVSDLAEDELNEFVQRWRDTVGGR
jgi:anti-sigma factor RsiW